jgi:hypothetical protein
MIQKLKNNCCLIVLAMLLCSFYQKIIVLVLMVGGFFVSPEGSKILYHYCFGNGDTLYLDGSYLSKSPVILRQAKKLKVGQSIKNLGFKQHEDWRLSYALNPFTIKRTRKEYIVSQWIEFDKTRKVKTKLNLFLFTITIPDSIVHCYDCTPFLVVFKFKIIDNQQI